MVLGSLGHTSCAPFLYWSGQNWKGKWNKFNFNKEETEIIVFSRPVNTKAL